MLPTSKFFAKKGGVSSIDMACGSGDDGGVVRKVFGKRGGGVCSDDMCEGSIWRCSCDIPILVESVKGDDDSGVVCAGKEVICACYPFLCRSRLWRNE